MGATLEKLTAQSVTDGSNRILEGKVLALDAEQVNSLAESFGGAMIVNGAFVPIDNWRIKEVLLVHPKAPIEGKIPGLVLPQAFC